MTTHREMVERMPFSMALRPRDERGYPIPWFTPIIDGVPDFRYVEPGKPLEALMKNVCWTCGQPHVDRFAFVVGPMCAVNRTSAEPPSHVECAIYAARACPFLARPKMERPSKTTTPPAGRQKQSPGIMLDRNPGVALVWVTRHPSYDPTVQLFDIGPPDRVVFYAHSRKATRAEVMHSIDTGLPALQQLAEQDGPDAVAQLERQVNEALELVPA